jgi:hypothetical protein
MATPPRDFAVKFRDDTLKTNRLEALRFYRGDNLSIYGNSGDGLSTVVSRDVMEAVESILPGLIKPFIAGDESVRFEPTGPEDEEGAKQATEYVNYLFQNHNDAVRVVYDFAKDGMMYRLGVAKVVHEEVDDKDLQTYKGIDQMGLMALHADDDNEFVGDIIDNGDGTFDCKCAKSVKRSMFRVYVIAPDEFLFEERLASLEDGMFFGHRSTKPAGDFIAMGLPKAKVLKLDPYNGDDQEADTRFEWQDRRDDFTDDDLGKLVTIDECYIRCDYEGDGVLSWRKVFMSTGKDILLNEEADDHPYCAWTPIPVPHKLIGMSIFDLCRDLQMQGTALIREMFNALYLANRPQREVVEGQVNFEDLLNPEVGGLVRVKAPNMVREIASGGEGVIQQSMAMLEQVATIREQRTGSTRYNQGMDANSLNKTATGISIIQNASTQRQELIARHLAEGIKSIFKKMLGLVCRHGDEKQVIRLRGQWVPMDPSDWKTGYDMSVAVGLGTGNRDQQVAQLTNLLNIDKEIIQLQEGAQGPIVKMENVYEKLKRIVEAMGLKGIENYYTDPAAPNQQQQQQPDEQQPDPAAQAQAEAQVEIEKVRIKAQADIEIARINNETKLKIAGMEVPPELQALIDAFQSPQEPQEAPPQDPGPPMAPEAQMMPDGPPMGSDGPPMQDDGGMMA